MNLRHAYRPWLAIILLVLAATLSAGCRQSPQKPIAVKPIPQADADDIVQLVATTLSADNGGWYFVIKTFAESLSITPPVLPATAGGGERWSVPLAQGLGVQNDFSLSKAQITYNIKAGWIHGDGTFFTARDTATRDLEAQVAADAGVFVAANGLDGTYGCHPYRLNTSSFFDSTFFATNLAADDSNFVEFSGFLEDSCFALVHSTITPGSARLWYHVNFADWTLRIPKTNLVSAPYPVGPVSEIHWNIEAYGLATPTRTDFGFAELVEARMTFNGTPIANMELADVTGAPAWSYRYTVNINTGQIARLP